MSQTTVATTGAQATTLETTGGNLFQIALQVYGDPLAAWEIAKANGLTDFWLFGKVTLTLPVYQDSNGGVPPQ